MEDRKVKNQTLHELMEDLLIDETTTREEEETLLEDFEEDL